jgi:hypothetical protein
MDRKPHFSQAVHFDIDCLSRERLDDRREVDRSLQCGGERTLTSNEAVSPSSCVVVRRTRP